MIKSRLYLYDSTNESNGYKGEELSQYLLQADTYTEDITNQVDTCELTLVNYPIRKEFEPQTKFILEKYEYFNINGQEEIEETPSLTYHLVVGKDIVSQPILSDNTKFDHKLFLYEPSIIAQQRLVDNSSVTYKLKDVSLQTTPSLALSEKLTTEFKEYDLAPNTFTGIKFWKSSTGFKEELTRSFAKKFVIEGSMKLKDQDNNIINSFYVEVENNERQLKFELPKLAIYCGVPNTYGQYEKVGYASLTYSVIEYDTLNLENGKEILKGNILSGSNFEEYNTRLFGQQVTGFDYLTATFLPISKNSNLDIYSHCLIEEIRLFSSDVKLKTYSTTNYNLNYNESGTIETDYFITIPNKIYVCNLYIYQDNTPITLSAGLPILNSNNINVFSQNITTSKNFVVVSTYNNKNYNTICPENSKSVSTSFQTYDTTTLETIYESATPYSCYDAIAKAIIGTETYNKVNNVFVGDINATDNDGNYIQPYPFYIDQNYEDMLRQTRINETFFSQKNLWEVLTEIGYYIHAVPEIKFGKNEKFMITFNKLGEPNLTEQNETTQKLNILNYKGVEDYISAVSSYVENIVQLGGEILEVVAPKTTDERFLVYNDTADIVVSKGIIELLDIQVKCVTDRYQSMSTLNGITLGSVANLTDFIFEKNVYDTLPLNPNNVPNKGLAMYYELGDNAIKGGDFRTPTVNVGEPLNDYTIKKIIYSAYYQYSTGVNVWDNIYVNDFVFIVRYRTKDSIRQHQTRPDLRKYLLNSKWDKVPTHYQFNNQTEILVDSERLGQNIYGKLIRTGNTNYKIAEWNNSLDNIKHKGELYDINGERYYVAKATHTFNADHIESDIEYSKDYNQLSQVIGIPSEPRFYEISEQSQIKREVVINDYLILREDVLKTPDKISYYCKDLQSVNNLIFGQNNADFAKFAVTIFKNDIDMSGLNSTDGTKYFYADFLSPLSSYSSGNTLTYSWDMKDNYSAGDKVLYDYSTSVATDNNAYRPMQAVRYTDKFGKANLLDFYILSNSELVNELTSNEIASLPESPYCTINFEEFLNITSDTENTSPSQAEILAQIQDDIVVGGLYYVKFKNNKNNEYYFIYTYQDGEFLQQGQYKNLNLTNLKTLQNENVVASNKTFEENIFDKGICLMKDCRESISINYNLNLLSESDTFVISPFVFSNNKTFTTYENGNEVVLTPKIVLLNEEVNKLSNGYIPTSSIINVELNDNTIKREFDLNNYIAQVDIGFGITFDDLTDIKDKYFEVLDTNPNKIKAIAIIFGDRNGYNTKFIMARNIPSTWDREKTLKSWFVAIPNKYEINTNKQ